MSPQSDIVYVPTTPGIASDNDDVTVGATVEVLLPANPNRKSALIINVGDEPIRVTTDGTDPTATRGKPVGAGGTLILTGPYCPDGPVLAIREGAANTTVNASEVV